VKRIDGRRAKRVLLVDADTLVYAAASKAEANIDWGGDQWTSHANLDEAKARFIGDVQIIERNGEADDVILAFTDYDNVRWRQPILPDYKENRAGQRKPVVYAALREWAKTPKCGWSTYCRPRLEGDDIVGILATAEKFMPGWQKVVCGIDKDLKQIPGWFLNYQHARDGKVEWEPVAISEDEADRFHMFQTLTGDTIDGYKGCPGIGPVKANKILDAAAEGGWDSARAWAAVVEAYASKELSEDVALANARVARILRASDYDFKTKEVHLWLPFNSSA
jgi:DNA polymerase-1